MIIEGYDISLLYMYNREAEEGISMSSTPAGYVLESSINYCTACSCRKLSDLFKPLTLHLHAVQSFMSDPSIPLFPAAANIPVAYLKLRLKIYVSFLT